LSKFCQKICNRKKFQSTKKLLLNEQGDKKGVVSLIYRITYIFFSLKIAPHFSRNTFFVPLTIFQETVQFYAFGNAETPINVSMISVRILMGYETVHGSKLQVRSNPAQ